MVALSDGEILNTFLRTRDEDAFEQLVERHGPMVLGVCKRVLNSQSDAEDAAQAVFLTLAHKAGSLDRSKSLAGWLHRVAWQVALDARKRASVRTRHEQHAAQLSSTQGSNREWLEVAPLLDEELNALPDKYRQPVLLHYIEGHTQAETATLLKQPAGTVSTNLNRAKIMLKARLTRRGVLLSGGVIAALLSEKAGAYEVSATMISQTSKAASLMAAGNTAAAGVISTQVSNMTKGALNMLFMAKMKTAAMILAGVTLAITTAGIAYKVAAAETTEVQAPPKPAPLPNQPVVPAGPLDKKVTFEFVDTPFSEAAKFIQSLVGKDVKIVLAQDLEKSPITLRVSDMPLKTALEWMAKLNDAIVSTEGNTITIQHGAAFDAEKQAAEDNDEEPWKVEINKKLERKISFEFVETPLDEAIAFFNSLVKANMIVNPKILAGKIPKVTLKVQNVSMAQSLQKMLDQCGLEYGLRNQAVFISTRGTVNIPSELYLYDVSDLLEAKELKLTMPALIETLKTKVVPPGKWKGKNWITIQKGTGRLEIVQRPAEQELIREYFAQKREELWALQNPEAAVQKAALKKKLEVKVTFEFVDTPLDKAIDHIRTKSGAAIVYDPKLKVADFPPINLRVTDMSAELALQWVLRLADLDYEFKDNAMFISTPKPKP